jgi:hypothetical protein
MLKGIVLTNELCASKDANGWILIYQLSNGEEDRKDMEVSWPSIVINVHTC